MEHGSFTPLVFSATEGMGKAGTVMYQRLPSLLSVKRAQSYSKTMSWLLTFSLLRSAITCFRGSRSAMNRPGGSLEINVSIPLAASEGRIPGCWTKLPIQYMNFHYISMNSVHGARSFSLLLFHLQCLINALVCTSLNNILFIYALGKNNNIVKLLDRCRMQLKNWHTYHLLWGIYQILH